MAFDLVYAFMQYNCVTNLSNAHDVCTFLLPDEGQGPGPGSGIVQGTGLGQGSGQATKERDVMSQISDTLGVLSDVDMLLARKYDPSSLLDRSDTSCFPEGYCTALLGRCTAVARGVGSRERYEAGKGRGAKGIFQGLYRPKVA